MNKKSVPYRADTHALSWLITVNRNRCSTALSCPSHVVPKLTTKYRCLRRASLQMPPGPDSIVGITRGAGIPSHRPRKSEASSPTRRDTQSSPFPSCANTPRVCH
jgi:hypothetical protein